VNPAEYERMFEAEETQWWYAGMRAIGLALLKAPLSRLGDGRARPRILDAGCGTGLNLHHLGEGGRALGVDLSAEALSFCRRRGVLAARASLLRLPFADGLFDCVTSFDVLYHAWVTDDRAAMGELVRVLRPGGLLLLRVPALKMLRGAHDLEVHTRHRYRRREVVSLLGEAGLAVERVTYCNTVLFPLVALRRGLDRLTGRRGSDVGFLPSPLEWAFRQALLLEAAFLRRGLSLPIGASLVALGRKPAFPPA
jgi:SAM-dependent methyltransferase